jgi:hypothetical protein
MNDFVRMTWRAPDVGLMITFDLNRAPTDDRPSIARVAPGSREEMKIQLREDKQVPFDLRFRSGIYIRGWFKQRKTTVDGVPHTGIFADLHVGSTPEQSTHFEGFMVSCPLKG